MSKRLSKVARELKVGISVLVDFLNNNGYSCEESPNIQISEEIVEFLRNNISAYVRSMQKDDDNLIEDVGKQPDLSATDIPTEIKLIDCVSQNKKLIENIIGFTDFEWEYAIAKFHGTCSQPVKFTAFDEIISKILLIKEQSLEDIGKILGLNIFDEAEKNILLSAINDLRSDKMVEGDESYYYLTEIGKEYAKEGIKFSTFERDFELYIDSTGGFEGNCREVFSSLKSTKQTTFSHNNLPLNIEDVKPIAEIQAPEIHFPSQNYILQECNPTGIEGYKAKVWVALLENFRDQTVRAAVYNEETNSLIPELSEAIDRNDNLKQIILDKLISRDAENDEGISYTDEEKNEQQIEVENQLISEQLAYDKATDENNLEEAAEIVKKVKSTKRHFNSVEFEVELKRLFEETIGEMWIISPWIKKYATMHRIPFFERYLKKGGRIFIAYSKPENGTDQMAEEEALNALLDLDIKYQNFYIHQLDPFHFKYVWVKDKNEGNWFYSGSFNILSFFVKKGRTKVRQEMMTKLEWGKEEEDYFENIFKIFGEKYLEKEKEKFIKITESRPEVIDRNFLQMVRSVNFSKLRPFKERISPSFDDEYELLCIGKDEKLQDYKQQFFDQQIMDLINLIRNLQTDANLSVEKKKEVQSKLNTLKNEYPDNLEQIEQVQELIDKLRIKDLSRIAKPKYSNKKNKKFKKRK